MLYKITLHSDVTCRYYMEAWHTLMFPVLMKDKYAFFQLKVNEALVSNRSIIVLVHRKASYKWLEQPSQACAIYLSDFP